MHSDYRSLWRRRDLILVLTQSNLKKTHRNTLLGSTWWVLDPLLMTAVYTLLVMFIRGGRGTPHDPYPLFVMTGLISWKFLAASVIGSVKSIADRGELIKAYRFPNAVLPLAEVFAQLTLFVAALAVLTVLTLIYGAVFKSSVTLSPWLVCLPVIVVVQTVLVAAAAIFFAAFGAFYRDLSLLLSHVLRMGWYLSPGLYAISDVIPGYHHLLQADFDSVRYLYLLNPVAHLIEAYRDLFLRHQMPDWVAIGGVAGLAMMLLIGATWVFSRKERKFTKYV